MKYSKCVAPRPLSPENPNDVAFAQESAHNTHCLIQLDGDSAFTLCPRECGRFDETADPLTLAYDSSLSFIANVTIELKFLQSLCAELCHAPGQVRIAVKLLIPGLCQSVEKEFAFTYQELTQTRDVQVSIPSSKRSRVSAGSTVAPELSVTLHNLGKKKVDVYLPTPTVRIFAAHTTL